MGGQNVQTHVHLSCLLQRKLSPYRSSWRIPPYISKRRDFRGDALPLHFKGKLLHVLVVFDVSVDGPLDDLSSLLAIFLNPLVVLLRIAFALFLLLLTSSA